jgi:hypothetical protein
MEVFLHWGAHYERTRIYASHHMISGLIATPDWSARVCSAAENAQKATVDSQNLHDA